jgi:hypothetical protein
MPKRTGLHKELFDLCKYIAASAEGLPREPKDYGPARLVEVLSRCSGIIDKHFGDEFLRYVAKDIDEQYTTYLMSDKDAFQELLVSVVRRFAQEASKPEV